MPTDFVFRLSTYLTLALACACLGYAESTILPEVPFIAAAVIVSLVVLFRLETRIKLLSIPDANRVGLVLGLVYLGWGVIRVVRDIREPGQKDIGWQYLLIALIGPLLMVTMPAKLARREKHVGDYWWLHGIALAAAGLSGAIAEDGVSFLLVGLYSICAVWSLALLYLRQAGGKVPTIPGHAPAVTVAGVIADSHPRRGIGTAFGLIAICLAVATPLYLITPRSPAKKLAFGKSRVQIGYAANQMLDLNQTGELTADEQIAFHVKATANRQPYTELSPVQRWRGRSLRHYSNGGWEHAGEPLPGVIAATRLYPTWTGQIRDLIAPLLSLDATPRRTAPWTPPQLSLNQLTLEFTVPRETMGDFLADPVAWEAGLDPPIARQTANGLDAWHWVGDGSFFYDFNLEAPGAPLQYTQIWHPPATADLGPPLRLVGRDAPHRLSSLTVYNVPRIKEYSDNLIRAMIEKGTLPLDCRDRISLLPRRDFHFEIAHAFSQHLATSAEFRYTTKLRRERKDVDPVEEFLFHTRSGHCERFASALVLLLRSQGIPAVLVLGFKGCEPTEQPGSYVVRQAHAHAWVETLVQAPGQSPNALIRDCVYHWLSLDPTPPSPPDEHAQQENGSLGQVGSWVRSLYNDYVANYTPEKRRKALAAIGGWFTRPEVLACIAAGIGLIVLAQRWSRRVRVAATSEIENPLHVQWFGKLLQILAGRGFVPLPGQTSREFALEVSQTLCLRPETMGVSRVPLDWADAYYEVRFGGGTIAPDEQGKLERGLAKLKSVLEAMPREAGGEESR